MLMCVWGEGMDLGEEYCDTEMPFANGDEDRVLMDRPKCHLRAHSSFFFVLRGEHCLMDRPIIICARILLSGSSEHRFARISSAPKEGGGGGL